MNGMLHRACHMFATRLETLAALLDKGASEWREAGRDPESLLAARLAGDMLPLVYQVAYSCEQPRQLAAYLDARDEATVDPTGWTFPDTLSAVQRNIDLMRACDGGDDGMLARDKHIPLQHGRHVQLSGPEYVDEWLVPNFYFHLVTAYDIMRHEGVTLGKADYMAHVRPFVRVAPQGARR